MGFSKSCGGIRLNHAKASRMSCVDIVDIEIVRISDKGAAMLAWDVCFMHKNVDVLVTPRDGGV